MTTRQLSCCKKVATKISTSSNSSTTKVKKAVNFLFFARLQRVSLILKYMLRRYPGLVTNGLVIARPLSSSEDEHDLAKQMAR
jgi:hypothetical protein